MCISFFYGPFDNLLSERGDNADSRLTEPLIWSYSLPVQSNMNSKCHLSVGCKSFDYFHHKGLERTKEFVSMRKGREKEILTVLFKSHIMMVYSHIHMINVLIGLVSWHFVNFNKFNLILIKLISSSSSNGKLCGHDNGGQRFCKRRQKIG